MNPITAVPFTRVRLSGGLLGSRQATNRKITLRFALEQCESSGRLRNFDLAAETMRRRAAGETSFQHVPPTEYPFDDTDVYKSIEGAAYCLSLGPDPDLEALIGRMIERVAAAQEPDGYLFTFRTMHPDSPGHDWVGQERWEKDPEVSHELYNLGHLYEAGVAHFQATGSRSLLDLCLKSAELVHHDLGAGRPPLATGHQVIEMGLAKLFLQTGDIRWLRLAEVLIDNRGRGGSEYSQNHLPVTEQSEAVGHAVRANYLYAGMADVAALGGRTDYFEALIRLWENVVGRKLHLTGGCGALASGEAYGADYELPHRCYNETCAAVAFLFWNHRMFLMTGEGKYMDVFERTLYNGTLSGVSLSGDRFFYPNTLEYNGYTENNHGHAGRAPWFGCACCPPNLMRLLASLGGYVAAVGEDRLLLNLYTPCRIEADVAGTSVCLSVETGYPWDGGVAIRVDPGRTAEFSLGLRIPGWVRGEPLPGDLYFYEDATPARWSVAVNGEAAKPQIRDGYAVLRRRWSEGDQVELHLAMPVRRVRGNAKVAATKGQVALERGPMVYAVEGVDNDGNLDGLFLPDSATVAPDERPDVLGGATLLKVAGAGRRTADGEVPVSLTAIPYALWNNRGLSPMRVWLPADAAGVPPPPEPTLARQAAVSVSFRRTGQDLDPINDQLAPLNATDQFVPQFDFWPHRGTAEWIEYAFPETVEVRSATVSWFDDKGRGGCRLPASWRIVYRTPDGHWAPVDVEGAAYPVKKADPVTVAFRPVTTDALRLEIQLPEGFCSGIYEWSVE